MHVTVYGPQNFAKKKVVSLNFKQWEQFYKSS